MFMTKVSAFYVQLQHSNASKPSQKLEIVILQEHAARKREWRRTCFTAVFKDPLYSQCACNVSKQSYVNFHLYRSTLNIADRFQAAKISIKWPIAFCCAFQLQSLP